MFFFKCTWMNRKTCRHMRHPWGIIIHGKSTQSNGIKGQVGIYEVRNNLQYKCPKKKKILINYLFSENVSNGWFKKNNLVHNKLCSIKIWK